MSGLTSQSTIQSDGVHVWTNISLKNICKLSIDYTESVSSLTERKHSAEELPLMLSESNLMSLIVISLEWIYIN